MGAYLEEWISCYLGGNCGPTSQSSGGGISSGSFLSTSACSEICRPVLSRKSVVLLLAERRADGAGSNLTVFVSVRIRSSSTLCLTVTSVYNRIPYIEGDKR